MYAQLNVKSVLFQANQFSINMYSLTVKTILFQTNESSISTLFSSI